MPLARCTLWFHPAGAWCRPACTPPPLAGVIRDKMVASPKSISYVKQYLSDLCSRQVTFSYIRGSSEALVPTAPRIDSDVIR
ncbi:hypothetical protein EVAR_45571_1 [Eumeta japonica]|uniref:Uncharacterized protein n=1 Tax=Eumeta variegata TaxID=151549 RepID=A0A4C1YUU6_EUMVA|nr:hypothetical protein EVAR_45571_1 [Eumeta japonica]